MTVIRHTPTYLTLRIPSVFCYLNTALELFRDFMSERGLLETGRPMVVLEELLTRALNRNDCINSLFIQIEEVDNRVFKITVEEQGQRLDHSSLDICRMEDDEICGKHDYRLLRDLSEELEFSREGSRITSYVSATV